MSRKIKINETCTNEEKAGTPENRMESPLDLLQERLAVLWEEVKEAGKIAKHGEILDDMETALMVGSRALLREFMEKAVAERVAALEDEQTRICEKTDAEGNPCGGDLRHRGSKKKR